MKKIVILFVALFAAAFLNAQTVVTWNVADSNHGTIEVIHPFITYGTTFSDTTIISIDTMYNYNEWFLIAKANDGVLFDYWVNSWKTDGTIVYDTIESNFNLIDIDVSTYESVSCVAYFMEYASIENIKLQPQESYTLKKPLAFSISTIKMRLKSLVTRTRRL